MSAAPPVLQRGIIKQVLSGDTVVIRGQPKGGPPPEKTFGLAHIIAPKLARRLTAKDENAESRDEPFAWEAREFLRKKLVGMEVCFQMEYKTTRGVECGYIYLGQDGNGENISESLVAEGYVEVKHSIKESEKQKKLLELEEQAKTSGKGKWGPDASSHVREIKWAVENPRNFMDSLHNEPVKAIIEHVRDGATVRAFLMVDSVFYHVTVMMSGIRCPMFKLGEDGSVQSAENCAEEAKFFTELRLLQRDVEIILESVNNNNFYGSVLHPKGSIAELLLKEGFARCIDWSISFVTGGAEKLRAAEKFAKEKRIRIWKDYAPSGVHIEAKDKEFGGKVVEVVNADALVIKMPDNSLKKIFLASIRPPRLSEAQQQETVKDNKGKLRPLYDIPYMYEAREFLRKKLIGKKVNVTVDYIQPASNSFPEKTCCTVTIGGMNVAEALVSKGLATVVRYRQDDDQRSSHYDELLAAETKANKSGKGLHSKKENPIHRVADISGDYPKAKQFLPFLQRAGRSDAVVEYVASGSRLRLYIPRETCLITFLLAGINCPRPTRPGPGGTVFDGEPFGEEALLFTKELCLQHEVEVEVESMDKAGNFIGWLWIESTNLSVALVEEGFASVHFSAERSSHFRALQNAEDSAKRRKDKIWSTYEEPKEVEVKDDIIERAVNYKNIVITNVLTSSVTNVHFHAQHADQGPQLEQLMEQLRQEFAAHPPLTGAYTPKKGELCAAKFTDNEWYRAKIEKISGNEIHIYYVDYGNREITKSSKLASLPSNFHALPSMAREYALACITIPSDPDDQQDALQEFYQETQEKTLLLNVEYRTGSTEYVTLLKSESKEDIAKQLISEGYFIVEERKEKRLQKLISEYKTAQETARKNRLNLWRYGDFMADDAKEFGFKR